MKLNSDSVCDNCKHFHHECYDPNYDDNTPDNECHEWCNHPDKGIAYGFNEMVVDILYCEGFEE